MPAAQLFCEVLEQGLNKLLTLDPDSHVPLQKLKGKRLIIAFQELPFEILVVASQQIDILCLSSDDEVSNEAGKRVMEAAHCYLKTSLWSLPELIDNSQLTQLIKQDKLVLEGDIQVAQAFSQLFIQLQIDWEEQLAKLTGDVVAHEVFRLGAKFVSKAESFRHSLAAMLGDAAIEEKQIATPATLVQGFSIQVNEIQQRAAELEARLSRFERADGKDKT